MKIVSTLGLQKKDRLMLKERFPDRPVRHVEKLSELSREELAETEVLFTYGDSMPEPVVEGMTSLKWIHSGQAGVDAMPKELLGKMGVAVTNSRGINSITIAEYVMGMLINQVRNNYGFYEAARNRIWDMELHLDELAGKTMGIFGLGMVGLEIAKRAKAFDMTVYGMNLGPVSADLAERVYLPEQKKELLGLCDYVVLCLPLTEETRYMIARKELEQMKPSAILVNVGRGAIVKEADLTAALMDKTIGGAVLDVFEKEPLSQDSPLWEMPNVILTPHIAGDRQASYMPRMMELLCYNLAIYPDVGAMRNHVNLNRGF